ncbi:hypothetical protein CEQ90_06675 [Lewinellaceae bacterium SD302]|nr:hypothetical protein CEQ90_06675 [Lewinellaceae bacterium SD302]
MNRKQLLLPIMTGWTIRNLENSRLLDFLNSGTFDLTVLTTDQLADQVNNLLSDAELVVISSKELNRRIHRMSEYWAFRMAKAIHIHLFLSRTSTYGAKEGYPGSTGFILKLLVTLLPGLAKAIFPWLRKRYAEKNQRYFPELAQLRFDLGLSLCVNVISEEFLATNLVCTRCDRSLGYVLSWDNPSSKPFWIPPLNEIMVWGEQMHTDVWIVGQDYLSEDQLHQVGALQMDWHFAEEEEENNQTFNVGTPFIFYACVTEIQFQDEPVFLEACVEAARKEFPAVNWYVRTHPKESGERFDRLKLFDNLTLDAPNSGDLRNWKVDGGEKERLRQALQSAFLVCTSFGTLTLEALIYGKKPVLISSPNQDGSVTSASRHLDYHHTKELLKKTYYQQVRTPEEMIEIIRSTLSKSTSDYRDIYEDYFINNEEQLASDAIVDLLCASSD